MNKFEYINSPLKKAGLVVSKTLADLSTSPYENEKTANRVLDIISITVSRGFVNGTARV